MPWRRFRLRLMHCNARYPWRKSLHRRPSASRLHQIRRLRQPLSRPKVKRRRTHPSALARKVAKGLTAMRNVAFEPCIPTRGTQVPAGPEWLHEIKHDGYRLIVVRDGARVRLFTRNGHDWASRYPLIVEAALKNVNPRS